jgi:hypothetical protein
LDKQTKSNTTTTPKQPPTKTNQPSQQKKVLYVRPDAVFDGSKPISGGVPHCFPQFGPGAMQQHGFARNLTWTVRCYLCVFWGGWGGVYGCFCSC